MNDRSTDVFTASAVRLVTFRILVPFRDDRFIGATYIAEPVK